MARYPADQGGLLSRVAVRRRCAQDELPPVKLPAAVKAAKRTLNNAGRRIR